MLNFLAASSSSYYNKIEQTIATSSSEDLTAATLAVGGIVLHMVKESKYVYVMGAFSVPYASIRLLTAGFKVIEEHRQAAFYDEKGGRMWKILLACSLVLTNRSYKISLLFALFSGIISALYMINHKNYPMGKPHPGYMTKQ